METYTATKFSTVKDKERFVKQFKVFVESDYDIHKFPNWFYIRLSMCFGHIAHYNQLGFYDWFFRDTTSKLNFVNQCIRNGGVGDPKWTFADAERQIQLWLIEISEYSRLQDVYTIQQTGSERAEYERLKLKYGK